MSAIASPSNDDRLTVWILVTALSVGGAERTIVELANNLDTERYDVVLWTIFSANPLAEQLDGVDHRSLGVRPADPDDQTKVAAAANPLDYARAPVRFLRHVRGERPDVLHTFLFFDNVIGRVAGLVSPGTAVVGGVRGFHNDSWNLTHGIDRLTLPLSDFSVSNSVSGARYLANYGVPESEIAVIPNGRDLEAYSSGSAEGLREELSLPAESPVVGTVGRYLERKGHFDLIRAWPRVRDAHPDAHLVVVGHGPEREALEALAADLGVAESVHLTGARDDVPACLDLFDVFTFPSHWEGQPGALLEAMAAGLPIAATSISGNEELLTHGESGLLVPVEDPDELAGAIDELLADPEQAAKFGEAAQAVAYDGFSVSRMVERFERIYDHVAGREVVRDRPQSVPGESLELDPSAGQSD